MGRRSGLTSASPGRGGGDGAGADRAQRGRGSSTTDRKIRSTYRGGACSCSRSAPAAAALNDHRNLAALLMFVALTRAREARRFPGALRRSDLLEPSGRRCGCWSTSQFLFSGIVGRQILVRGRRWSSGGRATWVGVGAAMVPAPIERSEVGGHRQQIGKSAALTEEALALARAALRRLRH